ncbi:MAG: hypothetical protein WA952_20430 [Lewinella sp.]
MFEIRSAHTTFPGRGIARACLLGAALGLALISTFVFGVDNPKPEWGEYWRIRPLLVTPLVGAIGATVAYYTYHLLVRWGWPRMLVIIVCGLGVLVALWLGIILGLNGTLWN